jgi:predicted dehydrogenase
MIVRTVSIAGFGLVGQRRYSILKKFKNIKVVAVSDSFLPYRKKFKNGKSFNSYKDMIKNIKTDIVFICLPNKYATKATLLALKNEAHVFCEKPPARNFQELGNLGKYLKNFKKQILVYGFNHRYHDSIIKTKEIIDSKKFGKVINYRGVYGKSYLSPKIVGSIKQKKDFSWRERKEDAGGGILLDQGIHMVDMINFFSGKFNKAKSFISNNYWKKNVEDNVYAILKNKESIFATIHSTATLWKHSFSLDISLENGMISLSGILSGTKSYGKEKINIIKKLKNGKISENKYEFEHDYSWEREIKNFLQLIQKNKFNNYSGGFNDALETMRVINLIYNPK